MSPDNNTTMAPISSALKMVHYDTTAEASIWVNSFNTILSNGNHSDLSTLFTGEGFWRDHLALSWDFHTLQGREKIRQFLEAHTDVNGRCQLHDIHLDVSSALRSPRKTHLDAHGQVPGIEAFILINTSVGTGRGVLRLAHENGEWKAFSLYTSLRNVNGFEEMIYDRRPKGVKHGSTGPRQNWSERRKIESEFEEAEPAVVIVGAGQAGLGLAARLKMMGIDALLIDAENRLGDNWRSRYRHLVLHDPVWYNHLPYINFPPNWPKFTPKDKLGDFFESYASLLELNFWCKTQIKETTWNETSRSWSVKVRRTRDDGSEEDRLLHPRHLVQATGHSGKMNSPWDLKGLSSFKGDRICHSSEFKGATPVGNGKTAVVVGSCSSGHDIAQDFYENGYQVTMLQRSSTVVVSPEAITDVALAGLYEENGPPVDDADLLLWSTPTPVFQELHKDVARRQNEHDRVLLDGLKQAGFSLDPGPNNAGMVFKYFKTGGGFYVNTGASQLIIDGKIKVKQGQEIEEVLPHGVRLQDGTELPADEIVFATGYKDMRTQTRDIFGDAVADQVKDVWGLDEEGEIKTMWRNSGHPGFWFMGGNLALCRYYSRLLALQIVASESQLSQNRG
ncbi:hypothetical protein N7517_010976 [Penicillium concentricum]|uniref:FAD/NAD(P)-binding domain-containing protein n=1 Tax=Penicillium concentricum TaxID=293559 RepID=A0A9W9UT42_9EURO|nr:uncharacterized protein N7517_010976 [Penicillium concentricum]KAJ5356367.1 hypothetical protein N7517_010976 [Penicillium concentricum]